MVDFNEQALDQMNVTVGRLSQSLEPVWKQVVDESQPSPHQEEKVIRNIKKRCEEARHFISMLKLEVQSLENILRQKEEQIQNHFERLESSLWLNAKEIWPLMDNMLIPEELYQCFLESRDRFGIQVRSDCSGETQLEMASYNFNSKNSKMLKPIIIWCHEPEVTLRVTGIIANRDDPAKVVRSKFCEGLRKIRHRVTTHRNQFRQPNQPQSHNNHSEAKYQS